MRADVFAAALMGRGLRCHKFRAAQSGRGYRCWRIAAFDPVTGAMQDG